MLVFMVLSWNGNICRTSRISMESLKATWRVCTPFRATGWSKTQSSVPRSINQFRFKLQFKLHSSILDLWQTYCKIMAIQNFFHVGKSMSMKSCQREPLLASQPESKWNHLTLWLCVMGIPGFRWNFIQMFPFKIISFSKDKQLDVHWRWSSNGTPWFPAHVSDASC